MTTTYIFPGQGTQYVGMGVEIAERYPQANALYNRASSVLGFNLLDLCRIGSPKILQQTQNAQPAIFVTSLACLTAAKALFPQPKFVAGLSMGEYAALVAAGALEFEDAVLLVQQRGIYMQEATAKQDTGMAAIIGLDANLVVTICEQASILGVCQPTNYNAPNQTVIGGDTVALEQAMKLAQQAGATKVVPLAVSGAFHTPLMSPAAIRLVELLATIKICDARVPVISNVTAQAVSRADDIRSLLIRQISSPVRWANSIQYLVTHGVDTFIEFGPGKTASSLIKQNVKEAIAINVQDCSSIEQAFATFRQEVKVA